MAVVHIDAPSWSGLGELGALLWLKTIPLSRVYTILSPRIYICVDDDVAPCSSSSVLAKSCFAKHSNFTQCMQISFANLAGYHIIISPSVDLD